MQYCFHHIPKTAGSSLQLRLAHREHIGQLPKGSTVVGYPFRDRTRFYRVSEDPGFDAHKPISEAFLRTYTNTRYPGNAYIVSGHYTTMHLEGKHYTWMRHPAKRDVSHFNYDSQFGDAKSHDFITHLSLLAGNFMVLWLYKKYCAMPDLTTSIEKKYEVVSDSLKKKSVKVYDSDDFENSWTEIANELKVEVEPRLNSNEGGKAYEKIAKYCDLTEEFKIWHRGYNHYDYLLYEEFCT